jgi:hypothetical protein
VRVGLLLLPLLPQPPPLLLLLLLLVLAVAWQMPWLLSCVGQPSASHQSQAHPNNHH